MAEAKVEKKSKYSVVLKNAGRDFYSMVVPTGTNKGVWWSARELDVKAAKKTANEMAKLLGTKIIDQT